MWNTGGSGWAFTRATPSAATRREPRPWGLRGVYTKGGKTRDIPLPSVVMKFLQTHVERVLTPEVGDVTGDTPLFWSTWAGRRGVGRVEPIHGKNIWRLCKTYGRLIGGPELKPHDLRHGVAMDQSLGMPAVLPPPEEEKEVKTAIGSARAKQERGRMKKAS